MKKLLLFAFVASIAFACGDKAVVKTEENKEDSTKTTEPKKELATKDKLVGDWQMTSSNKEELSEGEKSVVMTFTKDGKAKNNQIKEEANWEITEKNGKESIKITEKNGKSGEIPIISISEKQLVLQMDNMEITLTKK